MRRRARLLALAVVAGVSRGGGPRRSSEETVNAVAANLRCVVCQSLSVADSPSETARQMREIVRERLAAGETPEQVTAYFVERYGNWILLAPPRQGFTLLVWVVPFAGLALGLIVVAVAVRRWSRPRPACPPRTSPRWTRPLASGSGARWPRGSDDRGADHRHPRARRARRRPRPLAGAARARRRDRHPAQRRQKRLELAEERAAVYRALRELDFDHEAGHLADDDYRALRAPTRRAPPPPSRARRPRGPRDGARPRSAPERAPAARGWTRSPVTLAAGAVLLLVFGVVVGVSVGRYTEPAPAAQTPEGSPMAAVPPAGDRPPLAAEPGGALLPPEMLAGMLQAARQSLLAGRYSEAIAAYQAVLKRDPRNVDALTHLGLHRRPGRPRRHRARNDRPGAGHRPRLRARAATTAARCSTRASATRPARSRSGSASSRWCPGSGARSGPGPHQGRPRPPVPRPLSALRPRVRGAKTLALTPLIELGLP